MNKADAKYEELRALGTWGKKSNNEQIVALTAKITELQKSSPNKSNKAPTRQVEQEEASAEKASTETKGPTKACTNRSSQS